MIQLVLLLLPIVCEFCLGHFCALKALQLRFRKLQLMCQPRDLPEQTTQPKSLALPKLFFKSLLARWLTC